MLVRLQTSDPPLSLIAGNIEQIISANRGRMILIGLIWTLIGAITFAAFLGEASLKLSVGAGLAAGFA